MEGSDHVYCSLLREPSKCKVTEREATDGGLGLLSVILRQIKRVLCYLRWDRLKPVSGIKKIRG